MIIKVIDKKRAKQYLDLHHHLGYGVGVRLCFGAFENNKLCGVIAYGQVLTNNCLHKYGLHQTYILELKKMHCLDVLPRNSESQFISYTLKQIKKYYSHIVAIVTYCLAEEKASAYLGANFKWIDENKYISKYVTSDKTIDKNNWSKLNYNKKYKDYDVIYGHTKKYAYSFNTELQNQFIEKSNILKLRN